MKRRGNPYARPDARSRAARAEGYPARSVYKLQEIDKRCSLFAPGQRVLDLGAAPGSWTMYAAERVGAAGRVLAVDRRPIEGPLGARVSVATADVFDPQVASSEDSPLASFAPYDVVLSDMAPSTSGSKAGDQAQSFELFMRALSLAAQVGKPGGHFVAKLFMSADFQEAKSAVQRSYERVRVIKPAGTRPKSAEVYVVGLGLRAPGGG